MKRFVLILLIAHGAMAQTSSVIGPVPGLQPQIPAAQSGSVASAPPVVAPAPFYAPTPVYAPPTMVSTTITTATTTAPAATTQPLAAPSPPAVQTAFTQSPVYVECTRLASSNPLAAEQKAAEWLKIDQGIGAHHCRAMALYGQRRFAEAAQELALIRNSIDPANTNLRVYVARQQAKAWFDAARPDDAIGALSTQINELGSARGNNAVESKLTADLLLDRAKLRVNYGQVPMAIEDLDHAVSLTPANEEVLLERAGAFLQLNDAPLAKQDIALVLRLNPANPRAVALQERIDAMSAGGTGAGQTLQPLR